MADVRLTNWTMREEQSLEAERREPSDLEEMPTPDHSLVWPDGEAGGLTNPGDPVVKIATIQTTIEDPADKLSSKQVDEPPALTVNKITWPLVGRVSDPGRYMFKFGWLRITAEDLWVWERYPNAAFTLVQTVAAENDADEFRLGTFELRTDSNYSESER